MDEKNQENEEFVTEINGSGTTVESESDPPNLPTPHQLATASKDYSTSVVSSLSSSPSEVPPNVEQPAPLVQSPTEEQSKGASSAATFSLSAANISVQCRTLCKESEKLSERILNFANRLNHLLPGSHNTNQLQPAVSNASNDETATKIKENVEMLDTVIKEAVEIIQNFGATFNEMDDKMKQWVPATEV